MFAVARKEPKAEQPALKASRLVFIDGTAVTTKMTPPLGRAQRGQRLVAKVPHGHWATLVAALRANGVTAPFVIDGAMDGRAFLAYVEQVLVPTLKKRDIIVFMDNVRTEGRGSARGNRGCRSPAALPPGVLADLNPIENAYAKIKLHLRKGAARTLDPLEARRTQGEGDCATRMRRLLQTRRLSRPIQIGWNMLSRTRRLGSSASETQDKGRAPSVLDFRCARPNALVMDRRPEPQLPHAPVSGGASLG